MPGTWTRTVGLLALLAVCVLAGCRSKPKVAPEAALHAACTKDLEAALQHVKAGRVRESETAWRALESRVFSSMDGPGSIHKPHEGKLPGEWLAQWRPQYQREVGRSVENIAAAVGTLTVPAHTARQFVREYGTQVDLQRLEQLLGKTATTARENAAQAILFTCAGTGGALGMMDSRRINASLEVPLCRDMAGSLQKLAGTRRVVTQVPAGAVAAVTVNAQVEEETVSYTLSNNDHFHITVAVRVALQSDGSTWGAGKTLQAKGDTPGFSQARGGAAPVEEMSRARDRLREQLTKDVLDQLTALGPI